MVQLLEATATLWSMRIFLSTPYLLLTSLLSVIILALFAWIPIARTAFIYLSDASLPLSRALEITGRLLRDSFLETALAQPLILILSLAIGSNLALLVHFFRVYHPGLSLSGVPASMLGVIASLIGVGCAACGTIFLTAISASAAGLLVALPFQGAELSYIGLVLILLSTIYLARAIARLG